MPSPAIRKVAFVPKIGKTVVFHDRASMSRRHAHAKAKLKLVPVTTLPVDCTGGAQVDCPMDGNDQYGDCMEAAAAHIDNIWTFGRGQPGYKEIPFDLQALESQYQQASGGDNGLDEPTLLQQCWKPGLAGQRDATYVDSLDVDVTDVALTQYLIDQFFHVFLMWSVPDDFINNFVTGAVFASPGNPNPANGHGTPLTDLAGPGDSSAGISLAGFMRLYTWGGWCWVSPAFVASVQPASFVVFSARQFNKLTGLDAHGRHISTQAAAWQAIGGSPIPASVINSFPPLGPTPVPPTPPVPTPPPPVPGVDTITLANDLAAGTYLIVPVSPAMQAQLAQLKITPAQWLLIIEAILNAIIPILFPPVPPVPPPPK